MIEAVISLLENFAENRREYGRQLGQLLEQDPDSFQRAAADYLSRDGNLPSEHIAVWLLQQAGMLLDLLLDPQLSSLDEAVQLARRVRHNAERIDVHLARALKQADDEKASRILRLLAEVADTNRTLPLLTGVLRGESSQLRSKAARIFARYCQNTLFIENALRDADPNVRAAAVEGLGLARQVPDRDVLLLAMEDASPLVKAHAALASYRLGGDGSLEAMAEMTRHPDPHVRAAVAGVMGQTGDARCLPLLRALREDADDTVRSKAVDALAALEQATATPDLPGSQEALYPDVLYAFVDRHGRRRLYLALTNDRGHEVDEVSGNHLSVEEGGQAQSDYQVCTPEQERTPAKIAFVLDNSGSMVATDIQQVSSAVIRASQSKAANDECSVYKFSLDVESAVGLTSNSRHLAAAVQRPHVGLKTASRLHDAVAEALDDLAEEEGFRLVLVIADGPDRGSEQSLPAVGQKSLNHGIPVYVVQFGTAAENDDLQRLASSTGGQFHAGPTGRELGEVCQTIFRRIKDLYEIIYERPGHPPEDLRIIVKSPHGSGETSVMPAYVEPQP